MRSPPFPGDGAAAIPESLMETKVSEIADGIYRLDDYDRRVSAEVRASDGRKA